MKIGVSYNLFDGEELLEGSIKCIRDEVDYISVVYQKVSNFGNHCSDELIPLLNELKNKGLIDELFEYRPKVDKGGHYNEITKRNIGVSLSLGQNCSHHMSMDSDEYYLLEEFKLLKKVVSEGDFDSSACMLQTYYKEPIYKLTPPEEYYVSLLYKINHTSSYQLGNRLPVLVDPTRCMKPGKCKIFDRDEIQMHHLSYIRKDIRRKLENSSAVVNFKDRLDKLVNYYNNWEYPKDALMAGAPDKFYKIKKTNKLFNTWN
jgi:hypothetical protein